MSELEMLADVFKRIGVGHDKDTSMPGAISVVVAGGRVHFLFDSDGTHMGIIVFPEDALTAAPSADSPSSESSPPD